MLLEASTISMSSSSALPVDVSGRTAIARTGIGLLGSLLAVTVGGPAIATTSWSPSGNR